MIRVKLNNGDTAYAETPEEAVFAAITIGDEARTHVGIQGFDPEIRFYVVEHEDDDDGEAVRMTTLRALTRTH